MPFIAELIKYKSCSIVGLEKNTGKTECFYYDMQRLPLDKIRVAVSSIGIDGMMIYDEMFCLTTDDQSLNKGLSSFAAEMKNIDAVIKASHDDKKILALIDELLQDKGMSLIIVTHYNIKTYNNKCLRVKGLENGKMNYELVETHDGEVPHEALNIAESLGVSASEMDVDCG